MSINLEKTLCLFLFGILRRFFRFKVLWKTRKSAWSRALRNRTVFQIPRNCTLCSSGVTSLFPNSENNNKYNYSLVFHSYSAFLKLLLFLNLLSSSYFFMRTVSCTSLGGLRLWQYRLEEFQEYFILETRLLLLLSLFVICKHLCILCV